MSLFYYDEIIKKYEQKLNFNAIVDYLEKKFQQNKETKILITLISASWFYLIEGGFLLKNSDFDDRVFLFKWKEYIDIGMLNFQNNANFCYIAAYTLHLHWTYLGKEYKNKDLELIKKCIKTAKSLEIKTLAKDLFENMVSRKYHKLNNAVQICDKLFPTGSIIDTYFKEVLNH